MNPRRIEAAVQNGQTVLVGAAAGAFCWSGVIALAKINDFEGWRGLVIAACVETSTIGGGLEVRRRRQSGEDIRLPVCVMVLAGLLQVSAQLAPHNQEVPVWHYILAVVPTVCFMIQLKFVLHRLSVAADRHEVQTADQTVPQQTEQTSEPVQTRLLDLVQTEGAYAADQSDRTEVSVCIDQTEESDQSRPQTGLDFFPADRAPQTDLETDQTESQTEEQTDGLSVDLVRQTADVIQTIRSDGHRVSRGRLREYGKRSGLSFDTSAYGPLREAAERHLSDTDIPVTI